MGDVTGFKKHEREVAPYRAVEVRVGDWNDVAEEMPDDRLQIQGARCMECGIPFCHWGCPLGNVIPDWNDLVHRGRWREAIETLHATNNFPEFTGRICPAPCEESCVLNIDERPVAIRQIELNIVEHAFREGWITPVVAKEPTGKRVAVVGSGPAGLACAQQLARVGHDVTVFERDERIGGLLTLGIPDFKLEKHVVERRIDQMRAEGVTFRTGIHVGHDATLDQMRREYDAICLAGGSRKPRELGVPGRELDGIHFAMDFLTQQNRRNASPEANGHREISAKDRRVIVIGGGDTGSDCVGTSRRQGAKSVTQLEILPRPPRERGEVMAWPRWPMVLRTSSSHEEGCERDWSVSTKAFLGSGDHVEQLQLVRLEWSEPDESGRRQMQEMAGSEFTIDADLVLLAMGFTGPGRNRLVEELQLEMDPRGFVACNEDRMTSRAGVFVAGDMSLGASLVVRAIQDGKIAAQGVMRYLSEQRDG